jgi:uncharacterized protein (DUF952 family)
MTAIYKILPDTMWSDAQRSGSLHGSEVDRSDGFIHFSTAAQAIETAAKHFAGQHGLVLLEVATESLGEALRWEPSRGGALFPHLYGPLDVTKVRGAERLPLGEDGKHVFPRLPFADSR